MNTLFRSILMHRFNAIQRQNLSHLVWLGVLLSQSVHRTALADDPPAQSTLRGAVVTDIKVLDPDEMNRGKEAVVAPPNHAILSNTLNGWQFVPMELKKEYDATLKQLEVLQIEVDAGKISTKDAITDLARLKLLLKSLRTKIEASRVHVEGAQIHEQSESIEFELGPEKRLAITANHVRIIGWKEAKVKVELKKLVLSVDDQPVDDQLKAIHIVHEHGRAKFAGQTDAEWEQREAEFLAKDGSKLTAEQLAKRRKFVDEIRQSYAAHRDLLNKDINQLSIAGLDYQSNQHITTKVKSEGGDGQWGSARQRYGELTVLVPACESVCVRGAKRGLLVENLVGSLTIVDEDSTDSDARGRFEVLGLTGNLLCKSFPLQVIANVNGHATVESLTEFGVEGAGTSHHDDIREMRPARPFSVTVNDITDGVDLRFGRVNLDLKNISGRINVENEFGDTNLVATQKLTEAAHRIVSQSGQINVRLSDEAWQSVEVVAVTSHGGIRTNIDRNEFSDFHLTGPDKDSQMKRNWSGFRKSVEGEQQFEAVFSLLDRFSAILKSEPRSNGLDLMTRSGRLAVVRE